MLPTRWRANRARCSVGDITVVAFRIPEHHQGVRESFHPAGAVISRDAALHRVERLLRVVLGDGSRRLARGAHHYHTLNPG